jgi:AcrR family transcriptional regulator
VADSMAERGAAGISAAGVSAAGVSAAGGRAAGSTVSNPQRPTGLGRRGRRLSDRETEHRMLHAAMAMVSQAGLTVSLDHISFEDVIRDADVSRSAVYRRWPYKDLFFSDLVKELAGKATPTIVSAELELIGRIVAERLDWLETPELRHRLVVELLRRLSLLDFQTLYGSPEWRTYLALHATILSIADEELRDQVQDALARSERDHIARIASAWERMVGLLGYRLRPEVGATFETAATLVDSAMRGLVITALSMPEVAAYRAQASPFGAATRDEWSLPGLALASMALAFLEPDPTVDWDAERLASVRRALAGLALPDA